MQNTLEGLNAPQSKAVSTVNGPVLVLAGPGSGKTRVLTRRIAHLIDVAGVAPWNIAAVTFTNKAAKEMRERVERIFEDKFGTPLPGQPPRLGGLTIGTFHSICARILRVETAAIGYEANWIIYDTADQVALIRAILQEMKLDEKRYNPRAVLAHISSQKNELITPELYKSNSYFEEVVGRVYTRYQEALRTNNAMDFDDLLMRTTLLLKEKPEILRKYQQKWQYVLVDEFQDTNGAQYELISRLVGKPDGKRNIFVVGDEDQAIFRFRGADYRNVLRFRQDFPDAVVIMLEENYRSTQAILDVANSVIKNNRNRAPKKLHTTNGSGLAVHLHEAYNEIEEATYVCEEIVRMVNAKTFALGDFAVLYRTNAQSRAMEEQFVLHKIKYKLIGATRFYERKEIKDAMAYLRLINNSSDSVALDRVINVPPRGIGAKSYAQVKEWAQAMGISDYMALLVLEFGPETVGKARKQALPKAAYSAPAIPTRAKNALSEFTKLTQRWMEGTRLGRYQSVADLLDQVLAESGYMDDLRGEESTEAEERLANLQELRAVAAHYVVGMASNSPDAAPDVTPLSMFLEEVSLVSEADNVDENVQAVTLMTLHTAKGLEYPVVFIVGLEEGILPHARSLESRDSEDMDEERRLFYVGITRAKRRLFLLHAFRRSLWGGSEVQKVSRFVDEIPTDLLSGKVDRRARREEAYRRETTWGADDDQSTGWGKPQSARNPYNWSRNEGESSTRAQDSDAKSQRAGSRPSRPGETETAKTSYWSPSTGKSPSGASSPGQSARLSAAGNQSNTRKGQFKHSDSVQHSKFGVGTVIESRVMGDDEEVTVAFPGIGIKKLLASLAGLKKL
ncbi:MAG: UvrD-helicase domain-containing protein [Caldilineaceae bacterium]